MMTLVVAAAATLTLTFVSYASFFSKQTAQPAPLDPQVFVKDASATAGTGQQDIDHLAGLRPALFSDPGDAPLFSAQGAPLGFSLRHWLGAHGTVDIVPVASGAQSVTVHLEGLSPYGVYSLFESRVDNQTAGFTPLDGGGTANSFIADAGGSATLTVLVSPPLTQADGVVVVFHSDGVPHGLSRGAIGITAHEQLIVRLP